MAKQRRHKGKGRARSVEELRREGVQIWTMRAKQWEATTMIAMTAFEMLFDDYNTVRPRKSKESYIIEAKQRLIDEKKIRNV